LFERPGEDAGKRRVDKRTRPRHPLPLPTSVGRRRAPGEAVGAPSLAAPVPCSRKQVTAVRDSRAAGCSVGGGDACSAAPLFWRDAHSTFCTTSWWRDGSLPVE
jgi:hypothetical protein